MKTAMTKIGNPFSSTKKTTCSHSKGKRSILIPAWALSVRTVLWPPKKPLPSIPFAPFGCRTAGKDGAKLPERGKKWLERKRGQRKKGGLGVVGKNVRFGHASAISGGWVELKIKRERKARGGELANTTSNLTAPSGEREFSKVMKICRTHLASHVQRATKGVFEDMADVPTVLTLGT